jgi:hypothetical protein
MTAFNARATHSVRDVPVPVLLSIALSAFLMFTVEPLVGRLLLPLFGGGAMVWTAVLLFFQVVLVAGYAYAHASVTWLGRWGPLIHLGLAAAALFLLVQAPAALSAGSARSAIDAAWALAGYVGLPALVLSATTPLVSSWLAAISPERDGDPYWLFGLANTAALLGLLLYPILIEPRLGIGAQRLLWTVLFVGFGALLVWTVLGAMPGVASRARPGWIGLQETVGAASDAVGWARRGRWLLLAAVPSGLVAAVTTFLATDLISMPILWVVPLAVYLVSLVVAFSRRAARVARGAAVATPAAAMLLLVTSGSFGAWPLTAIVPLALGGFLVVATGLHGRLAHDRPHRAHLTDFYLTLTVGAAAGSALVAIVAPSILPDLWEYPILLVGALVALALGEPLPGRPGGPMTFGPFFTAMPGRLVLYLVGAGLLVALLVMSNATGLVTSVAWLAIGGLILLFGGRRWFLVVATILVVVLAAFVLQPTEFRGRSFFGITRVVRSMDSGLTVLVSGTTIHGTQWTDPARRDLPTAYYGVSGPAADLFEVGAQAPATGAANVGVVGLGAGALSAYAEEFTVMTYFEIDPVVVRVAQDPALFTYLADAPGDPRIVMGDGRRSLAAEPDGTFDLLVLDAFSSNAVPIHLLTAEAIIDALRTVDPDGVIGFHVSNRYYDLAPPIAAALAKQGLTTLERSGGGDVEGELPSRWLATSRTSERLDALRALGWTTVTPADHPFTDDYADLLSYLKLGF